MKKTIKDFDLTNKTVIIRCDFNVPMKDGEITDDNRIKASLETIEYAINHQAKVVLMSHLGRVKTEEDKQKNTLEPVALRLSEYLNQEVIFCEETHGDLLKETVDGLQPGEVLLMENTRFEDLDGKKESGNNPELGAFWASLGDVFINDAFGTAHRAHASNVGIASHLPSGVGFLIEKELKVMGEALTNPKRPFDVILGGSKVSDKIGVIENLVHKADHILIGGGMAFSFLKASGIEVGGSLVDVEHLDFCKKMLDEYKDKLILPIDVVVGNEINEETSVRTCFINEIKNDEMGLDIGPKTVKLFSQYLEDSKTIIWNGPVGVFEISKFSEGTKNLCEVISKQDCISIIGGGDTAAAVIQFGYKDSMTHISTGGGASLELLEGKQLPGIECINEK